MTAPRLKEKYTNEIVAKLEKDLALDNVNKVPRLEKIVVNMGVGAAAADHKLLDAAMGDLRIITGQQPCVTRAKKSIAGFHVREGQPIGCKVTLRGDRMWEFLDRLLATALPRVRDFRGISPTSFDGRGNYTMGVTEQLIFSEIDYDKIDRTRGMDITFVTTAPRAGLPVQGQGITRVVPPKAAPRQPALKRALEPVRTIGRAGYKKEGFAWLRNRWSPRPSASRSSRRVSTTAARAADVPAPTTASSACAASACASWPTKANCPA